MERIRKPFKSANILMVTQGFHNEHKAIDIVAKYGTPLVAPEDCQVLGIRGNGKFTDNVSELANGYGIRLRGLVSGNTYLYWHTLPYLPLWSYDTIKRGQIVAFMGNSGNVFQGGQYVPLEERTKSPYRGSHLHLEMCNPEGTPIDPLLYIDWFIEPEYTRLDYLKAVASTLSNISKAILP